VNPARVRITRELFINVIAVSLLILVQTLKAQSGSKQPTQLDIRGVHAVPQVYVTLQLRTFDQQVFVPYCGQLESGEKILCTVATHLEVETHNGWHPAKLRTRYGVLGGVSLEGAKGALIPPHTDTSFAFQFSRRFFEVDPGQRLRLVVETWGDERSMRAGDRSLRQLVSPSFRCPETGLGL